MNLKEIDKIEDKMLEDPHKWEKINYENMLKELPQINPNEESIHHQDIVDFVKECKDIKKCRIMVFAWGRYSEYAGEARGISNAFHELKKVPESSVKEGELENE